MRYIIAFLAIAATFMMGCGDTASYEEKCNQDRTILTGGPGNNNPKNVDQYGCPTSSPDAGPDTGMPDASEVPETGSKPDVGGGKGDTISGDDDASDDDYNNHGPGCEHHHGDD